MLFQYEEKDIDIFSNLHQWTFNKRKVQSALIENIWGADLADMQLISKINKEFRFLLCVINIHSKYVWVILLKDKKGTTITELQLLQLLTTITKIAFLKTLKESNHKANKIWIDKGSECYNKSMKSWLEKMLQKCIQHIMKGNLLLLKELLKP